MLAPPEPDPPTDVEVNDDALEAEARRFAEERHADQRYGQHPYAIHLAQVRAVLAGFGYGGALGVAAWLHDAVEDTATSDEEIAARFGEEVAALVWAVTGVGRNRKERNRSAYEKIQQHPEAALLKLADRIANAEASREHPESSQCTAASRQASSRPWLVWATRGCGARLRSALGG